MANKDQLTYRHVTTTVGEREFHLYDVESHHWVVEVVYHPGRNKFDEIEYRTDAQIFKTNYFEAELVTISVQHSGNPVAMASDVHKLLTNFLVTLGHPLRECCGLGEPRE